MTFSADSVAIVGVGLIGGSIGLSLRHRIPKTRVIGIGRNPERLRLAHELHAISEVAESLEAGVQDARLIVIGSPVDSIPSLAEQVAAHCPTDAVITDVGSTKQHVVEAVNKRLNAAGHRDGPVFVGSHPLAGKETTGVEHAEADLLVDRTVVVTPTEETPPEPLELLESFWRTLGARVVSMTPAEHDDALASTSHLPHVVAALLASVTPEETLPLVSTGWLDTTRVAAGDIEMWRQILAHNRTSVLRCLEEFETVVTSFRLAMQQHDDAVVAEMLENGKQRRDALAD